MVESPPKLLLSLPVNEHFSYWQEKTLRTALKMVVMKWISYPASVNISTGANRKYSMDSGSRTEQGQSLSFAFWHF